MQKQLEEVAVAKEKRRTDRMEAHATWVAENPGGAMAKVQEHQQRNMEKAEQGREEALAKLRRAKQSYECRAKGQGNDVDAAMRHWFTNQARRLTVTYYGSTLR